MVCCDNPLLARVQGRAVAARVLLALALVPLSPLGLSLLRGEADTRAGDEAFSRLLRELRAGQPRNAVVLERNQIDKLDTIARTRRMDAVHVLIDYLRGSRDPDNFSPECGAEMLSSALIIGTYYGPDILPILYVRGIEEREDWLQVRIVLTIRMIADPSEVERMNTVFSLANSHNEAAARFLRLMRQEQLRIDWDLVDTPDNRIAWSLRGRHERAGALKEPDPSIACKRGTSTGEAGYAEDSRNRRAYCVVFVQFVMPVVAAGLAIVGALLLIRWRRRRGAASDTGGLSGSDPDRSPADNQLGTRH
jgi:hypothetical protein